MASTTPFQAFGLSCPDGGTFNICQNSWTHFIGCCAVDACSTSNNGTCPQDSLRASSFSADSYVDLPKQDCRDKRGASIWYICKFNRPPFMGCCNTDPCASGQCQGDDLVPAKLSNNSGLKASFLSPSASATPTTISTRSTSSTQLEETTTPSSPTTTSGIPQASGQQQSPDGGGLSGGAIGGTAAGVAVILIIIIAGIMYRCGWYGQKKKEQAGALTGNRIPIIMSQNPPGYGEGQSTGVSQYQVSHLSGPSSPYKFSQHPSLAPDGGSWHYSGGSEKGLPSPPPQFQSYHSHNHSQSGSSQPFLSPVAELGVSSPRQELPTEFNNPTQLNRPTLAQNLLETPYLSTVMPSTPASEPQPAPHDTSRPQAGGINPPYPQY